MKTLSKFILIASLFLTVTFKAQSSACIYSTCVPSIPFTNTDLLQIYGAVLTNTAGGGGGGTSTVVISGGTITTGNVGGFTSKVQSTISVSGSSYDANICVGGVQTATFVRTAAGTAVINDLTVFDPSNQKQSLVIDFWNTNPSTESGSNFANGATTTFANTNYIGYLGSITINTGDYITSNGKARATITGLSLTVSGNATRQVFYTITGSNTSPVTYTQNLYLTFGILQD